MRCCSGIPPTCDNLDFGINCYTEKNPESFTKFYNLMLILMSFVLGPVLVIHWVDKMCIYKPCGFQYAICQFLIYGCALMCCCIQKKDEEDVDSRRQVKSLPEGVLVGGPTSQAAEFNKMRQSGIFEDESGSEGEMGEYGDDGENEGLNYGGDGDYDLE